MIDLILIILIHISRISLQQTRRTGRARALTAHLGCQQGYSTAFNIARQDVQPVMSQEIPRSTSRRVETLWSGWTIWSINIHQMYVNIILTHIHIYIWLYLYNSIPVSVSISHDAYICISVSFSIWDYIYMYMGLSDGVSRNFNICQTTPGSPRRTRPKPTWALDQNQGTTERAARNHL